MFTEIKTLKVDNYALENQTKEILQAVISAADEKIKIIRKNICLKSLYRCDQNLKDETNIADKYDFEFYNYETNEILGGIRVIIKNVEESNNDK